MNNDRQINGLVAIIIAVIFLPIILFSMKTCSECPSDKALVRGMFGFECVAR